MTALRILWLKTEPLHPVDKGGRIRTYAMLRELRRQHQITYVTLDDGGAAPDAASRASEYCSEYVRVPFAPSARGSLAFYAALVRNLGSTLPYAIERYRSVALQHTLERLAAERRHDVLVCDFLAPSLNVPSRLGLPTVLFQHNVEAVIWRRHAEVARNVASRLYFGEQARRMANFEALECRRFEHVVAVSEDDRAHMRREYGVEHVSSIPTGVDTAYFRPSGTIPAEPDHIVFVGSLDWMPNEDGIAWFAESVLPLVRSRRPAARLTIVGRQPSARMRRLADGVEAIDIAGSVPDVRPYLERASVVVVPLRVGGGTRLKIYEALAMERAVVSTTIGAEGLPLVAGRDLLLADSPTDQADAIVGLLEDSAAAARLGMAAADRVRREFGWAQVAERFAGLCVEAASHGVAALAAGR